MCWLQAIINGSLGGLQEVIEDTGKREQTNVKDMKQMHRRRIGKRIIRQNKNNPLRRREQLHGSLSQIKGALSSNASEPRQRMTRTLRGPKSAQSALIGCSVRKCFASCNACLFIFSVQVLHVTCRSIRRVYCPVLSPIMLPRFGCGIFHRDSSSTLFTLGM